jgi:hypothetical protein
MSASEVLVGTSMLAVLLSGCIGFVVVGPMVRSCEVSAAGCHEFGLASEVE